MFSVVTAIPFVKVDIFYYESLVEMWKTSCLVHDIQVPESENRGETSRNPHQSLIGHNFRQKGYGEAYDRIPASQLENNDNECYNEKDSHTMTKPTKKNQPTKVTSTMGSTTKPVSTSDSKDQNAPQSSPSVDRAGPLSTERVFLLGASLLLVGTLGFYYLPGMIVLDEESKNDHLSRSRLVDAFYCAAITLTT